VVLAALLESMPLTALIRNLGNLTAAGVVTHSRRVLQPCSDTSPSTVWSL
jgi:CBS-domain-containing membrane protein